MLFYELKSRKQKSASGFSASPYYPLVLVWAVDQNRSVSNDKNALKMSMIVIFTEDYCYNTKVIHTYIYRRLLL